MHLDLISYIIGQCVQTHNVFFFQFKNVTTYFFVRDDFSALFENDKYIEFSLQVMNAFHYLQLCEVAEDEKYRLLYYRKMELFRN